MFAKPLLRCPLLCCVLVIAGQSALFYVRACRHHDAGDVGGPLNRPFNQLVVSFPPLYYLKDQKLSLWRSEPVSSVDSARLLS